MCNANLGQSWDKDSAVTQLHQKVRKPVDSGRIYLNKQNARKGDKRREGFSGKIDSLSDIAAERAVHREMSSSLLSKKKEDVRLCQDQRNRRRKGTMRRMDKNLSKRVEEKEKRELGAERVQASASGDLEASMTPESSVQVR